jgi:hypothetical protein
VDAVAMLLRHVATLQPHVVADEHFRSISIFPDVASCQVFAAVELVAVPTLTPVAAAMLQSQIVADVTTDVDWVDDFEVC